VLTDQHSSSARRSDKRDPTGKTKNNRRLQTQMAIEHLCRVDLSVMRRALVLHVD
jgi:hypothetical protein